ncbi:hypothetical protein [Brevibacillus agri]|uniref:hypothetical protein n=1 Tax=Brevibacillus agri TaxID=51101 RepID=UPI0018CFB441|nr:hypothetical protein [Brevibacillus agri]
MKTRLDEHPLIMQWINSQSNHGDSIRYLIEQDIIRRGGVQNLQLLIPTERNLGELMNQEPVETRISQPVVAPVYASIPSSEFIQPLITQDKAESVKVEATEEKPVPQETNNSFEVKGSVSEEEHVKDPDHEDRDEVQFDITDSDIEAWA